MFGDTVRDVFTNLRGTLEMLGNVANQLRPPHVSSVDQDLNGKVLLWRQVLITGVT